MDYSKFLEENFDSKEWINNAFRAPKETEKEQFATSLVMKLQMVIQEVNSIIDDTSQQALDSLPRIVREVEALRQEMLLLQQQMLTIRKDVQKVEHDTAQSMEMLLRLDIIKTRMNLASDALKEADNWTTLSADVDDVFESRDIDAIASKVYQMHQCLQILKDLPDYVERSRYLEVLKNRLEALVAPKVIVALSSRSLEEAQKYSRIFQEIGRLSDLYKYYHRCHKGSLVQMWQDLYNAGSDRNLELVLRNFYDELINVWHTQFKWCSQVFPDSGSVIADLLTEVLVSLDPPLGVCFERAVVGQPNALALLCGLSQVTDTFAKTLESQLEAQGTKLLQSRSADHLAQVIHAPYKPYVGRYRSLEDASLTAALDAIPLDSADPMESVELLVESVQKAFQPIHAAIDRCLILTHGCGSPDAIGAIQKYLLSYTKEFRRVVTNIREKCHVGQASHETEADNWSLFQSLLRLVQATGDFLIKVNELDDNMAERILTVFGRKQPVASADHSAAKWLTLLVDSSTERRNLELFIDHIRCGDAAMFDESKKDACDLSKFINQLAFDVVFAPIEYQLKQVPSLKAWTAQTAGGALTSDLPTFSLSPQEYITKTGQYLMMLPQQLEAFSLESSAPMRMALRLGKLPFSADRDVVSDSDHLANVWLESLARATVQQYYEFILNIANLSHHGNKQLLTDIDYLCSVLEDLGLQTSELFKNLTELLRAPADSYAQLAEHMPQRLTSTVAAMRHLTVSSSAT